MSPLNILIDARSTTVDGSIRSVRGLVYGLLQLPPEESLKLTLVVAPGQKYFSERRHPISLVTARKDPQSPAGARELAHIAARLSPDVIHMTSQATCPRANVPVVMTVLGLAPLVMGAAPSAQRREMARAVKRSQLLIAPSRRAAEDLVRLYPAAAGKLHVVPESADDFISGEKQLMPELIYRLPPTQFFLAMGNSAAHKNLPTLLRAFERFYDQASALPGFDPLACPRLLLVGRNQPGYLESLMADGPARELVCFTGRVTDEELRWLYAHALAFVIASRYEGFSRSALEAAGFAAPVLAAYASSLPEVLGENEAAGATYFDVDDVDGLAELLLHIARDQSFVDTLAAAAYRRAQLFSWQATARATLALYWEIAGA